MCTVVYWVWSDGGFLSLFRSDVKEGAIDFAGSAVVHLTGGVAALVACILLGPRTGRFDDVSSLGKILPHSEPLQALGVFFLWIGWFGFNGGSVLEIATNDLQPVIFGRVLVTTMLGAASAICSGVIISTGQRHHVGFQVPMNCCLAGLVSVTAGCSVIEPWAAIVIGAIGAIVFKLWSIFMKRMKIDDVVDAVAVHGACGIWGVVAAALFSKLEFFEEVYGSGYGNFGKGAFYGGNGYLLGFSISLALCIQGFVGFTMFIYFYLMNLGGFLRVSVQDEQKGLDESHHGGPSYASGQGYPGVSDISVPSLERYEFSGWQTDLAKEGKELASAGTDSIVVGDDEVECYGS